MRTVEVIDKEINELREKMASVRGTETEVYTRIVGYYRSVRNWNKGKRDEYNHRKLFSQPGKPSLREAADTAVSTATFINETQLDRQGLSEAVGKPAGYLYFYRTTCPNCVPVKLWLENSELKGEAINVDEKAGFETAAAYQIFSSPTVIFHDADGKEMYRATSTEALDALFTGAAV